MANQIYKIVNLINDKIYIGQTTVGIENRWRTHIYANDDSIIHKAMRKYGINNFKIECIYECDSIEDLNEKEVYFIEQYNSFVPTGYNLTKGGRNNYILSIESKNKISKSKLGDLNPSKRLEVKEKIRNTLLGRPGTKHTEEMKAYLSKINMGNKKCLGRIVSEETRLKISKSNKGNNHKMYGKNESSEWKKKISDSIKKHWNKRKGII